MIWSSIVGWMVFIGGEMAAHLATKSKGQLGAELSRDASGVSLRIPV